MGPAAVGPGSVRVPVPTRRRGPQPCCSRVPRRATQAKARMSRITTGSGHSYAGRSRRSRRDRMRCQATCPTMTAGWSGANATSSQTVATRWPTAGTPSQTLGRRPRTCGKRNMTDVSARAGRRPRARTGAVRDRRRTGSQPGGARRRPARTGAEGQIRPSDRQRRDEAAQRGLDDGGLTLLALAFAQLADSAL